MKKKKMYKLLITLLVLASTPLYLQASNTLPVSGTVLLMLKNLLQGNNGEPNQANEHEKEGMDTDDIDLQISRLTSQSTRNRGTSHYIRQNNLRPQHNNRPRRSQTESRHRERALISCPDCFKTFRTQHEMKEHIYVHKGLQRYICVHCNMKFRKLESLKQHYSRRDCTQKNNIKKEPRWSLISLSIMNQYLAWMISTP